MLLAVTTTHQRWAELLKRTFHEDILRCPKCQQTTMAVIAVITDAAVLAKILTHLGLPIELPTPAPARYADQQLDLDWDEWAELDVDANVPSPSTAAAVCDPPWH